MAQGIDARCWVHLIPYLTWHPSLLENEILKTSFHCIFHYPYKPPRYTLILPQWDMNRCCCFWLPDALSPYRRKLQSGVRRVGQGSSPGGRGDPTHAHDNTARMCRKIMTCRCYQGFGFWAQSMQFLFWTNRPCTPTRPQTQNSETTALNLKPSTRIPKPNLESR